MNPETRDFLDHVACVAQVNLNYLYELDGDEMNLDDQGSQALMSAYLELYDQFMGHVEHDNAPSSHIYNVASACCAMRREMELRAKSEWSGEEHGLFTLMLGFMYMFKHLYVVRA